MGSPSFSSKNTAGSPLTSWPISMSAGLIGVPSTSWTTRIPFFQTVWLSLSPGSGPRSRSGRIATRPSAPMAPSSELRISGRRPMPDSSTPVWRIATVSSRSSSEEEPGVAVLDDLVVAHQLAGPLDHADADAQQGQPEADAERDVGGAEPEDLGGVVADLEDEVGDAEQHHEEGRETEQRRDLALGALLEVARRCRSGAAGAPGARGRGSVRSRPGRSRACRCSCGAPVESGAERAFRWGVHAVGFFLVERAGLAAIHTAKPTSTPMPTSQANRPSGTGPSEPRVNPPYAGVASFFFR